SAKGHIDIVNLLLGHPSINAREIDGLGRTALFLASRFGQHQVVQSLFSDNRIDTQATDIYSSTCLFPAVANGHLDVAKLLIARGMVIEKQNSFGRDMAWWALNVGNPQMADWIAQHSGQSGGQAGDTAIRDNITTSIFDCRSAWCDAYTLSTPDGCEYYCDNCGSVYLCRDCFDRT
ncbi:ankyrin repeat-containing domain protein, partial [Stachybotrys elegans]